MKLKEYREPKIEIIVLKEPIMDSLGSTGTDDNFSKSEYFDEEEVIIWSDDEEQLY